MPPFTSSEKPSFCWWLHLFDVPATGLPVLMILAFFVSPSVNPPLSSISAANCGPASLRCVNQLGSALSVVGREQISSGMTVNSHKFVFGLHHSSLSSSWRTLILTAFVSLSSPSDSLRLLLSLSGSPMSASSLCSLGGWSSPTLDSAGRGGGSFPEPSRELDVPVPSMTPRSGRCSG